VGLRKAPTLLKKECPEWTCFCQRISSDSVGSHKGFADECGLPFKILSDPHGKVRRAYGVSASMGLIPGRVTYVIDKGGIVRYVFSSQIQATRHVKEALEALNGMGEAREVQRPTS